MAMPARWVDQRSLVALGSRRAESFRRAVRCRSSEARHMAGRGSCERRLYLSMACDRASAMPRVATRSSAELRVFVVRLPADVRAMDDLALVVRGDQIAGPGRTLGLADLR